MQRPPAPNWLFVGASMFCFGRSVCSDLSLRTLEEETPERELAHMGLPHGAVQLSGKASWACEREMAGVLWWGLAMTLPRAKGLRRNPGMPQGHGAEGT